MNNNEIINILSSGNKQLIGLVLEDKSKIEKLSEDNILTILEAQQNPDIKESFIRKGVFLNELVSHNNHSFEFNVMNTPTFDMSTMTEEQIGRINFSKASNDFKRELFRHNLCLYTLAIDRNPNGSRTSISLSAVDKLKKQDPKLERASEGDLIGMLESGIADLHVMLAGGGWHMYELCHSNDASVVRACFENSEFDIGCADLDHLKKIIVNGIDWKAKWSLTFHGVMLDVLALDSDMAVSQAAIMHENFGDHDTGNSISNELIQMIMDCHDGFEPETVAKLNHHILSNNQLDAAPELNPRKKQGF